ncbi:MAG: 16S rRNA (adenine(1518)-N(6)/adenine(1519)-N(6))-dimethyltransferase RsmA [Alphaproteobacteria bacterium]|nr:16S rRNA (adenine(1518)-N(6)/adenine(1519)-N(6))-dimethyltransferase RsmA [Alphaproteobacteria bacterium]
MLPPLKDIVARYDLLARKSLGQHFLFDLNLTGKIARMAGDLTQGTTIEVGPGPGGLTRALLDAGASQVIAIEKDERCLEALAEVALAYPGRLEVLAGDAMQIDASSLGTTPRRIVSNLPYNVGTPLLIGWLRNIHAFESLTLMFQREVADRLIAPVRSPAYGRLSVLAQWQCEVKKLFDLPPSAFTPPPKVSSSVVRLVPRPLVDKADFALFERVTAAAFGQRRKMLRSSLKSLGNSEKLLAEAGITPTARAEEIGYSGFAALARALVH